MNIPWVRFKGKVCGLTQTKIAYAPLLPDGDSSPYFGTYEGQRYGAFDTSNCWDFSAAELAETRLEMLEKMGLIPKEHLDWAKANGYKDTDGDWYVSRRWVAILSGARNNGNTPENFWDIASVAGLIPNSMLSYDPANALKWLTQDEFNNDYFNPQVITKEMELVGKEFARRFKIKSESIPGGYVSQIAVALQTYLKEGSVQISHPVPHDGSWNRSRVEAPKDHTTADHATECYKYDPLQLYSIFDYDSYEPHLKQLSKDYFINYITRVSIIPLSTPTTPPQVLEWQKFWYNIAAWFQGKPFPYPSVPVGSA